LKKISPDNPLAVRVVDPLVTQKHRERRIILDLVELRHDMTIMIWEQINHLWYFLLDGGQSSGKHPALQNGSKTIP
jgi:hypothetical protein